MTFPFRPVVAVVATAVISTGLFGCGGSDETTTSPTTTTSSMSSTTSSSTQPPSPPPDLPMTESGLEKVCPDVVTGCKADDICKSAWTDAAKCDQCECISQSISDAAQVGVTPALEALAGCLADACVPSTTTSKTTTTTTTSHTAHLVNQDELQAYCPSAVDACKSDNSCSSAWTCMKNAQQDCSDFGDCLSEAAKIQVTDALEEMGSCLADVCSGKTPTTTTTTSHAGPAIDRSTLQAYCPSSVEGCKSDSSCSSAWSCMKDAPHDCNDFGDCLSEAAKIQVTSALEEMSGCLSDVCSGKTPTTTTTTKSSSPAISQKDMQSKCPSYVDDCKVDKPCSGAWDCMGSAQEDCNDFAQCIADAATISNTPALNAIASCMDEICTSSLVV